MQQIKIQNITWNYRDAEDHIDLYDPGVGFGTIGIPDNMILRLINECGWERGMDYNYNRKVIPHYDEDQTRTAIDESDHQCYNADTQIVVMNWLHAKRRNYNLDYNGTDPYWIFHDHFHSKWDVYGNQVGNIVASTEYQRVLEGAEMARANGILIKPKTAVDILKEWKFRFANESCQISERDFSPFFEDEREEEFEFACHEL